MMNQYYYLNYLQICLNEKSKDWTIVWDDEQKVPYMHKGNQWISYDNPKSIGLKVLYISISKYYMRIYFAKLFLFQAQFAKQTGLGGVMIWSIETDDFRGLCDYGKYPLLESLNSVIVHGKAPVSIIVLN